MFGLTLAFAEKTLSGLIFSALVVGIATFFGQPFIFDPIMLLTFVAIALAFRRNIDLLSICAIFIAARGLEELMYRFLEPTIWFKIPCYFIFLLIPIFLASGPLRVFATLFVSLGICIEVYWGVTEYAAPNVIWNLYLFSITIVIRKLLRMRVFWLLELRHDLEPRLLPLDSQLLIANACFIVLHAAIVLEYWARHVFGMYEMLYVYSAQSFIAQTMSLFIIYMIIIQSIHHLQAIELDA